ncbi:hypothetical protein SDC9_207193 [bioreactor metagenome]|uniref:Uncharacterized protein n=1 Tax=bioreactor metagenome TaxID=1076179 RepID=A0A645J8L5_9ZZZZ
MDEVVASAARQVVDAVITVQAVRQGGAGHVVGDVFADKQHRVVGEHDLTDGRALTGEARTEDHRLAGEGQGDAGRGVGRETNRGREGDGNLSGVHARRKGQRVGRFEVQRLVGGDRREIVVSHASLQSVSHGPPKRLATIFQWSGPSGPILASQQGRGEG